MFFQGTKENQIKSLKKDLLTERLSSFADSYLEKQEHGLVFEIIKNASDLRRLKNLTEKFSEQNARLSEDEAAMLNILEDARELEGIIREEKDQANAIISSMGEGLLVIDSAYKIILMNKNAEFLLGIPKNEIIGNDAKKIIKVFKQNEEIPEAERPAEKMFRTQNTVKIEMEDNFYYQIIPSGKKFPVALVATPLRGNGITGAVIVFRDITAEKALDESKTGFIFTASHQLRTPLTAIRWYAEMLQSGDAGKLNKDQKNFLSQIYGGVLRLGNTLNILLSLARIESGQTKIISSKINFFQSMENIVKELELPIKQKNLNLTIDAGGKKPEEFEVLIDQTILNQVIANLLSNSIRYTDKRGNINIKIIRSEKELICSVKDDGIGIPENQKNKIFEKFFRADNAKILVPDGNGLGMVLVKNLVELWKGKIWFESPADWNGEKRGTIFYFTIPIL